MKQRNFFVFAGEHSGDLHGSFLVKAMKEHYPNDTFEGVAGPKMRSEGVNAILSMESFQVMGITDVVLALPRLYSHFKKVRDHILSSNPLGVILIDYAEFNLRMAKALRKKGYQGKIVHYISPSVWAWGKHRIGMMAKTLDLLLTIYPFESACFEGSGLSVAYVGNPLCEYLKHHSYNNLWKQKLGMPLTDNCVSIFPGSRYHEVKRNLPIMLEAAARFKQKYNDAVFGISCVHEDALREVMVPESLKEAVYHVPKAFTYELMRDSRTAMAKSGTVTLELALHGCPTAVIYKLTALNRLYAKYILKLKLPYYCMVNILANKEVYPELIESGLSAENLLHNLMSIHSEGERRAICLKECAKIRKNLDQGQASSVLAAQAIAARLL